MKNSALDAINQSSAAENRVWNLYLKETEKFLLKNTQHEGKGKPINQINIIGSNIVKNRAIKVAAAAIVLNAQKNKKTMGIRENQYSDAEVLISKM